MQEKYLLFLEKENDELSGHDSLLKWTQLLSKSPSGKIVVCQPNDDELAHMGELSAETFVYKNIKGYIVDGGCRDTAFIKDIKFPVFYKYTTPKDVVGKWEANAFWGRNYNRWSLKLIQVIMCLQIVMV